MPIDVFEGVTAEVKTLVVPEGGELPPEEELAAMEAAERRGGRGGGSGPERQPRVATRTIEEALAEDEARRTRQAELEDEVGAEAGRGGARAEPRPRRAEAEPESAERAGLGPPAAPQTAVSTPVSTGLWTSRPNFPLASGRFGVDNRRPAGESRPATGDRLGTCVPFFLLVHAIGLVRAFRPRPLATGLMPRR